MVFEPPAHAVPPAQRPAVRPSEYQPPGETEAPPLQVEPSAGVESGLTGRRSPELSDVSTSGAGMLTRTFPKIGLLMDDAKTEVLAFTGFPRSHWPKVWSTNPAGTGE